MATATSSRRSTRALAVLITAAGLAAAAITLTVTAVASPAGSAKGGFPPLVPAAAPASWRHLTLPNGTAVLSYPPALRPLRGDRDAVSAARVSPRGAFLLYLNATPRQGDELLEGWASFRLRLLRADDAATVRQVAAAQGVRFRGGTGSCVIDSYLTKIGAHHFQEIACLVEGHTSASVIVAAAPAGQWAQARQLLLRAVAAYQVQ
jgi:hypothetical protein